ncbi:Flavin-containing monooxygenase [Aphelenchoides besseyi]|nr:Flavin-containing monooxygenase [Aphelenchoides besseyi]
MLFPLNSSDKNTLAVMGLFQPLGTVICRHRKKMREEAEKVYAERAQRYVPSPRHTVQLDYTAIRDSNLEEYMEDLSKPMGACPNILFYLFTDPVLAHALTVGPDVPYIYRLKGLHAHPEARKWILEVNKRIRHIPTDNKITKMTVDYRTNNSKNLKSGEGGGKRSAVFTFCFAIFLGLLASRCGKDSTVRWLQTWIQISSTGLYRTFNEAKAAITN